MTDTNLFYLDLIRLIPVLTVIAYAAYSDIKFGEVKNKVWLYTPIGLTLTTLTCILYPQQTIYTLLSFGATGLIAFTLFYLGGWGGADAKAFLMIGAALPVTPFLQFNPIFMYPLNVIWISSVIAFVVAKLHRSKTVRFLPYVLVAMVVAIAV